ncbi:unnamed protein product, partial [Mesorhabditis belari]|uniref:Amino acid transporter transmembrane domain-containing protein n=1 Tax=Mesorhabditis belari TaxID=2138241 RepID=A0AAF3F628_9BILA
MENGGKISFNFDDETAQRKTSQVGWRTGISGNQALMNFCRVLVGTGVLALPLAFKQSGSIMGIFLVFFGGYFFTYLSCDKMVVSALALAQRHGYTSLDYGNVAEKSFAHSFHSIRRFGPVFRYFANISILLMQMGVTAVYTVFIKEHFEEIWNRFYPRDPLSEWNFFLITLFLLCLLVMLRNIKIISWISTIGNILMMLVLTMVFQDLVRPPYSTAQSSEQRSLSSVVAAAGNIVYAYCSQAVVLPLANKMKEPREMSGWRGVLSLGCSVVTVLYALVGFFGYLKYGDAVRGSVTLNLPDTTFYFMVRVILVFVVFSSYLIQHFVMIDMALPFVKIFFPQNFFVRKFPGGVERLLCVIFVGFGFLLAVSVPNLGRITSLVGVTAGCLLGFIIPASMHTATFLPEYLQNKNYKAIILHIFTNFLFFIFGIFFTITGIVSNLAM